jgi:hypothetical protein
MRHCINCNSTTTTLRKGTEYEYWYRYKDGYVCKRCYNKLFLNPKWYQKNSSRQLTWTPSGKIIRVKENPRKGICQLCGAIKGIDCKYTQLHHIEYHEDDPLKDTIELCPSCHMKTTWQIKPLL